MSCKECQFEEGHSFVCSKHEPKNWELYSPNEPRSVNVPVEKEMSREHMLAVTALVIAVAALIISFIGIFDHV